MSLQAFFANFSRLVDAPNGVAQLRELVLQLAARGKLTSQDAKDEDATLLAKRILQERVRLTNGKSAKGIEGRKGIQLDEAPYLLPNTWIWQRLEDVFYPISVAQNKIKSSEVNESGKFPVVDQGKNYVAGYTDDESKLIRIPGQVVIFGDHTCVLKLIDFNFVAGADGVKVLRPIEVYEPYFFRVGQTFDVVERGYSRHYKFFLDNLFPLAPLQEQKRIVARIDELLRFCDELESRQQSRRESRVRLNNTTLAPLNNSASLAPEEFEQASTRLADNFDTLYDSAETVGKLRSTILQLAVQGKLISQDKSRRPKGDRVSDYLKILNGYAFKSEWFVKDGIRLVRNANIGHGTLRWDDLATIPPKRADEFSRFALNEGDIVISLDRPLIATGIKVARVKRQDLPSLLLQRVGKVEFKTEELDPEFFFMWLHSPSFINAIDPGRSNGVPHISSKSIESISLKLPPLKEQKRIVAKVEQLMALCDELETKLRQAEADSEKLMNAAAQHVLDAVSGKEKSQRENAPALSSV